MAVRCAYSTIGSRYFIGYNMYYSSSLPPAAAFASPDSRPGDDLIPAHCLRIVPIVDHKISRGIVRDGWNSLYRAFQWSATNLTLSLIFRNNQYICGFSVCRLLTAEISN